MKPVIPFEPVSTEKIPTGSQWVSQVKWDGVRVLTYFNGNLLCHNSRVKPNICFYN